MPPTSLAGAASARAAAEVSVMNSSSPKSACRAHHTQSGGRGHTPATTGLQFSTWSTSVVGPRVGRGEGLLLLDRGLALVLALPFLVRHAVNDLARVVVAHLQPALF